MMNDFVIPNHAVTFGERSDFWMYSWWIILIMVNYGPSLNSTVISMNVAVKRKISLICYDSVKDLDGILFDVKESPFSKYFVLYSICW